MTVSLLVLLWGAAAIGVITSVGRWCRAHPSTVQPPPRWAASSAGSPGPRVDDDRTTTPTTREVTS